MPPLSVWMIRASFLHLAAGFLIGSLLMWQKGPGGVPAAFTWLPVHIHFLLVGWIVQLAAGVAYWILPRFTYQDEEGRVQQARGRERLARAAFLLLNGSSLAALATPLAGNSLIIASALLAALAGLSFVLHAWPRVKPFLT